MIYWVPSENENPTVKQYLNLNGIEYTVWDELIFEDGKCIFVLPKNKFFLIMPYNKLKDIDLDRLIYDLNQSDGVIYFCSRFENNSWLGIEQSEYFSKLENVYLHADSTSHGFKEGKIVTKDLFTWSGVLDQNATKCYTNTDRNRDFLLTTIIRKPHKSRIPRQKLVDSLTQKNLLKNYIGNISHKKDYSQWAGMYTDTLWLDGNISWDLYNCANYELVPETLYEHTCLFTEKLLKPIVAHIPFIIFSNKEFYDSLHKTGFETFGNLIDESFSIEPDLDKRIDSITNTMLDLNPKEFYSRSREICRHNYNNLCVQHHRSKIEFQDQLHELLIEHLS